MCCRISVGVYKLQTANWHTFPLVSALMAEKKVTYLCVVRLLLDSTTVLEGLFGEYHSSSAALGKRRLGVTKQPPFGDWGGSSNTRTSLMFKTSLRSNAEERSVAGV